jgi:hypothetical protein
VAGDYVYKQAVTGAAFTTRIFLYVGLLPYRTVVQIMMTLAIFV